MNTKEKLIAEKLPRHIAIIMDGNGRWAKEKGKDRLFGHYSGVESVRNIVEGCAELKIQYLTLYAFSTENWDRPKDEVTGLMELLVQTIHDDWEVQMQELLISFSRTGCLRAAQYVRQRNGRQPRATSEITECAHSICECLASSIRSLHILAWCARL